MRRRGRRHASRRVNMPRLGLSILAFGILLGAGIWAAPRVISSPHLERPQKSPQATAPPSVPAAVPSEPSTPTPAPLPATYRIAVPGQSQYPKLPNGCEVTSLSMLLTAVGHPVNKMTLAKEMPIDSTPLKLQNIPKSRYGATHKVVFWGNPNVGFVGNVYKKGWGYGIYNGPLAQLLNRVLPGRAENLTGDSFSRILAQVARGIPVEVWTTINFKPTRNWVTWNSPEGPVRATPLEHAVLLVGYSGKNLLINNPANGRAGQSVVKAPFVAAWKQLGKQALSVHPLPSARP